MDAKQAIATAKKHLLEMFQDEMLSPPRLEEIWFDDSKYVWCVTLGFFRKPDDLLKATGTFSTFVYKVVRIDDATGQPQSIRNREAAAA